MSIIQHPEEEQIEKVFTLDRGIDKINTSLELPERFTGISSAKTLEIANDNDNQEFLMADE